MGSRRASEGQVEWTVLRLFFWHADFPGPRPKRKDRRSLWIAMALVSSCFSAFMAAAQTSGTAAKQLPQATAATAQILSSYEGQNVTTVAVGGRPDAPAGQYSSLYAQKIGQPFSNDKVDQTAAALKSATKCAVVRVQVDPEANGVRVLFVLEPAFYFGIFQFPGARRFNYSRLVQVANYPVQTAFNAEDVETDRKALITFFQQQGYFQAAIATEIKTDQPHRVANVIFHVNLGRPAKFGVIDMVGTPEGEAAQLNHSLQTVLARLRGSAIRPGKPYHYSTVTKANEELQAELEKRHRLDAQVKLAGADYHADTNRADIHFTISEGPSTSVAIQGAHIFSWTRKALLPVYQGVGADDESLEEGRQALASYFQNKGFFDVKVDAQLKKDNAGTAIVYQIAKNKKHKVSSVTITGNAQLPASELTSHLAVEKKHLFSPGDFSDKLVRTSVGNLKAVYESEGFSSVQVASKVENRGGDINVSFRVTEGPRDVVNSINIEGADTFPQSRFAPGGLKLAAGQPYSQAHIQADRANIIAQYLQAGYLTSTFRETAVAVSKKEPHRINVVYHITEGPRVDAGDVVTLGRDHTQQRLIDGDIDGIKTGQPLTETELLVAGSKLYDHPGVFDWAEVDPKRDITTQTQEDVLVKVHEASRSDLTYGIGFEIINRGGSIPSGTVALPNLPPIGLPTGFKTSETTFYGPRGSVQYTRNNLRGKGDSISLTGFAGRLDQRGAAYYIVPNFRWSRWKASTSLSAERNEENPIFSSQEELASTQIQRNLDAAKKDTFFLRYSFSQTDLTRVLIDALVPAEDRNVRLSTMAANVTRDTRDNPMDEHKGVLQSIELDFNTTKLGSSVDFAKLTGQAAFYKQGFHGIVFANSLRIGLAQPFASSFVPLSESYFTGGGSSLRGFPLDGAGPQRPVNIMGNGCVPQCTIQVPSGGNELLLINSEARIPLPIEKGLGIVLFYDGGNVFPSVGFHDFTSLYSNNVGLGLRYATPVGPVRIDLGQNLNPISGIKATNYFISIGQAF
jgi:outer membrane protein insertion porin family